MSKKESHWAWLHPNAEEGDTFAYPGNGSAHVLKKEEEIQEGRVYVRFLVVREGEKLVLPQWTSFVPKGVPPHLRRAS
ncbi:hypothetical protein K2X83_02450 [Patescibacteria group bacterium]|nr:hypothetical protein [Patescibacteria group bacterium]